MKTIKGSKAHQGASNEKTELTQIAMQEQFIKQVTDNSLPADQVLIERNDSVQNENRALNNQAPLFVP